MDEFSVRNKISEITSYMSSNYCSPEEARMLCDERKKLEKILEGLKNDPQKQSQIEREED